jgi:DNA replication protein DnaC
MSDKEYNEVIALAKADKRISLRHCPTCGSKPEEPVPGVVLGWPTDSTYKYDGHQLPCDCKGQDEWRRRYLLAHIPKGYWTYGENEYYGDPGAWQAAEDYLASWPNYRELGLGIEFYSETQGTGKTFLVSWIARQLIQRGEAVYYTRFREIMGLYDRPYEVRKDEEDRLRTIPVLVLDEVGAAISGSQGDYFAMEFEDLIRARVDDNRVTLMTTNLTPDKLDANYARTYSLLAAKQIRYEINFEDARRAGNVRFLDMELAKAGEVRPLC